MKKQQITKQERQSLFDEQIAFLRELTGLELVVCPVTGLPTPADHTCNLATRCIEHQEVLRQKHQLKRRLKR